VFGGHGRREAMAVRVMVEVKRARGEAAADGGDRREQILARAGELFAAKGVAATTVREIGNAVGLLSGSLYHYFDSKEAMVDELVSDFLGDLSSSYAAIRAEEDDPRRCLAGLVRVSFHLMAKHSYACHIYQHDFNYLRTLPRFATLDGMAHDAEQVWLDALNEGVKRRQFRDDVDPVVFYRFVRDSIFLAVRWYRPGGRYQVDQLADACITVFMEGYALDGAPR
jgi:TetR/AcrR family transcriptional regulator, cholesterol catabolism regulator